MNKEGVTKKIIDQIEFCDQCNLCVDSCPTYNATKKEIFAPPFRLNIAKRFYQGDALSPEEIESIYNCPQCGLCDILCPNEIMVSDIMDKCRRELVMRGFGPLDKHNKIIEGILKVGNSVNGDPDKRWNWLPEEFPRKESDTLFYVGCLPSYLVQNSARSSYLVLKGLGVDFMLYEDEDCCGIYFYNAGRWDLARENFEKNQERFKKLGIKRIITNCAGCFYCFKNYYPQILGETDFDVLHIVEMLPPLLKERELEIKRFRREGTYLDSCRLGRKEGIYDPPRESLKLCGLELKEAKNNKEKAACCGAGAGIRSVYRDLSFGIALQTLDNAPSKTIITACPFCSFNLSYASKKGERGKDLVYITDIVLETLSK
ncbi:MAG: (Fe-S)-binding protein [Thermodesulfobacteriota bacterium]|nr:(Fe-S)-binding protein [Thermodesulfobacteriota bacterium]